MLRPRRRGIASVNAEVRDGIVPAAGSLAKTHDEGPDVSGINYRIVALIIACALLMENLDATVLATALPTMARDFGVRAPQMSIALTSYLLALAVFIPASGTMADRFGSRPVFQTAIALFMAGSLVSAQAPALWVIVLARFVQGIGGAMMLPVGRLVLLRSVAKKDMVSAMSWLIMPALIGPILGPPLGGYIVTYLDWRWIFYVNLPIGLLGFVLVGRYIANFREKHPHPFDPRGFVLSGIALGCLLFGFEMTSRPGALRLALALIVVGAVSGALYVRHARRHAAPIIDLRLLRDDNFRLSMIAGSLTRITQGSLPFLLPLMMQLGFGLTAAQSGTVTVGPAIGSLLMKSVAPRLLRRFGFRDAMIAAGLLGALGYAVVGLFRPGWPMPAIVATLTVCGFFFSLQFTAYNALAYDGIEKQQMSAATSFYSTVQQLMLSLGICIAAGTLHLSMTVRGVDKPVFGDFTAAFWAVTAISLSATIWNLKFRRDAGAEISGQAPEPRKPMASSPRLR